MTDLLTEVNSKSNTLDLSDKTIHRDVVVLVEDGSEAQRIAQRDKRRWEAFLRVAEGGDSR